MGACCLSADCSKISGMTPQLIKKGLIGGLECVSLIKLYKSAITRCGFHCKICSFANRRLLIPDTRNEELNHGSLAAANRGVAEYELSE